MVVHEMIPKRSGIKLPTVAAHNDQISCSFAVDVNQGSLPMTFVGKLSVFTAFVAFAFVGAIVLGMI
jgi:hypothetical protein